MKDKTLSFDDFAEDSKEKVEKQIVAMISDKQIVSILEGGKRLRSTLAGLSFKACTQGKETADQYRKALEGGVIIELAHGASLVHDDIIDEDILRRGKPSFHAKEGVASALFTGHKMLVSGFSIALRHGKKIAELYTDAWNELVTGEIDEVNINKKSMNLKKISTKEQIFEAYNKIIDLKTATLFSSACKVGAVGGNVSDDVIKVFSDYGREIGIAYQLADDLVDLVNGEIIDSVVIPLLNKLGNKIFKIRFLQKRVVKRKFAKNKDKIHNFYIEEINKHVRKAEELSRSDLIPKSKYKNLLGTAPAYIINKMLREINVAI
ncbi:MAG: polyprenyl synthetase family protein [Thermoplasmatales archaeon]|nr:polyprenyl synthetase family protein [Thermoplasmatales archaeon]